MEVVKVEYKKQVKKTPRLRFSEFEGDWKEKRLGILCSTFKSGIGITSKKICNQGEYPVYGGNGLRGYTNTFSHDGFYVLIGRQGALCGNINRVYGKSYISEHAIAVCSNETSDTEWLAQKLDYLKLNRLSESSAQPGLAVNKLVRLKLVVPSRNEQQKIATFLSVVDKKIQQLTRKKELLEQYKKGVMQKIFSREIRFKDVNGNDYPEWEENDLADILNYVQPTNYLVKSTEYNDNYNTPVLTAGKTFILGYTDELKGIFDKHLPVIIFDDFTTAFKFVDFPFKAKSSAMKILKPINEEINMRFVFEAMKCIRFPLGEHKRYWISEYQYMRIPYPHYDEQLKISSFLHSIESKIEANERQNHLLKLFKKGLLQQMFV